MNTAQRLMTELATPILDIIILDDAATGTLISLLREGEVPQSRALELATNAAEMCAAKSLEIDAVHEAAMADSNMHMGYLVEIGERCNEYVEIVGEYHGFFNHYPKAACIIANLNDCILYKRCFLTHSITHRWNELHGNITVYDDAKNPTIQ